MSLLAEKAHEATIGYLLARERVEQAGYVKEIDHATKAPRVTCPTAFLIEVTWVVVASGLSDRVVRAKIDGLLGAFDNFRDPVTICRRAALYRRRALHEFKHPGKIGGILSAVGWVVEAGWEEISELITEVGADALRRIPYIGPATSMHLLKNLGVPVAKPDRHLLRIAALYGFDSPEDLCSTVSDLTGDPIPVVDLVFWRCAALYPRHYVAILRSDRYCSLDAACAV